MSLLADHNLAKIPRKRLCEHDSHCSIMFEPNFKRPRANVIRQFPKHCGSNVRANEYPGKFDFVEHNDVVLKIDSKTVTKNSVQPEAMVEVGTLKVLPERPPVSSKWKRRLGVVVVRQFPPNCGSRPTERLGMESNMPKELTKVSDKLVRDEDFDRYGQKNDKNINVEGLLVENPNKCTYLISGENCMLVKEKAFVNQCLIKQEEYEGKVCLSSSLEYHLQCQNVSKEGANQRHKGHNNEIVEVGKSDSEFILKDKEENSTLRALSLPVVTDNHKELVLCPKFEELSKLYVLTYEECQVVDHCNKVHEALKLFDDLYNELLQKHKANPKGYFRLMGHLPMEAAQTLKKQQKWVNMELKFGHVPGIKIGDSFRFRAELAVVGLHRQYICGIDYVKIGKEEYATSVVDSGRYENEIRSSDILIYVGQGGNPKVRHRGPADQKLEGPNRALMNSMLKGYLVRVIHGCTTAKMTKNKDSHKYIYYGLYMVINYTQEREQHGKLAYKFELHRILGQPKLTHLPLNRKAGENCVVSDVSEGKEKAPIRALNGINNEKPPPFVYTKRMIYPNWYHPPVPSGCNCIDGCSDSELCSCAVKNGGEIPFNGKRAIIRAKPIVYECGPSCKCPSSCKNKVSQHGPSYPLEIFRIESKGWGVRSRHYISSGSFICEYVGELLDDKEAERRIDHDEYLFDIGIHLDHLVELDLEIDSQKVVDDKKAIFVDASVGEGFAIDAKKFGNVGRFINHSCSPNLFAQNVMYDHGDEKVPHIMLFAAKNIRPLTELTYDYNYKMDRVCDEYGNIKKSIVIVVHTSALEGCIEDVCIEDVLCNWPWALFYKNIKYKIKVLVL